MAIKNIKEAESLEGKRVLVRADFNVPVKNGKVLDSFKIERSLETIRYLIKKKAKVILISHLGRPEGHDKLFSLKPVRRELEKLLKRKIGFEDVENLDLLSEKTCLIPNGAVTLLENIRFIKGEESNNKKTAKRLAQLADLFVLDGFAVCHRNSASVSGVADYLPSFAGLLLKEEIEGLDKILRNPARPMVVVLGGAKTETKIPVLKNLMAKADHISVGGAIFNTYLLGKGKSIGASLADPKFKNTAVKYLSGKKIVLPVDVVVGNANGKKAISAEIGSNFKIKNKEAIYDIGVKTIKDFSKYIKSAKTLVWNGAMGNFETHPYEYGTRSMARLIAGHAKGKAFGVYGGGETVEILKDLNLTEDIDLVSTGGGALLEYLAGKKLPGLLAIDQKSKFNFNRIVQHCVRRFTRRK